MLKFHSFVAERVFLNCLLDSWIAANLNQFLEFCVAVVLSLRLITEQKKYQNSRTVQRERCVQGSRNRLHRRRGMHCRMPGLCVCVIAFGSKWAKLSVFLDIFDTYFFQAIFSELFLQHALVRWGSKVKFCEEFEFRISCVCSSLCSISVLRKFLINLRILKV